MIDQRHFAVLLEARKAYLRFDTQLFLLYEYQMPSAKPKQ